MSANHHGPQPLVLRVIVFVIFFAIIFEFLPLFKYFDNFTVNLSGQNREEVLNREYYKVTKVTDGDTIEIDSLSTNNNFKVRLIGINTPESVDPRRPVECFGKEASEYMKDIAEGETVYIENDPSQDKYDKYGRLLAYIYLEDGQMLNRKMISEGYAYEYTYANPYKYQDDFLDLQNFARIENRGLWNTATCNGLK